MLKTHTCGELTTADVGQEVQLAGWVNRRRDHGGIIFIDLRDRFGIIQVTVDPDAVTKDNAETHANAETARSEYVLQVTGVVRKRPEGFANPNLPTGEVEVVPTELKILNPSKTPPFYINSANEEGEDQADKVDESLRLKYRYLDLRRERMMNNMILRHTIVKFIRDYFSERDFLEIETPILLKSTPEGARDFVVPSRMHEHEFYALPQSPQQLKQLLMVAGVERYFQIARCFRDEDLRADRQLEFTQLDLEMSFVEQEDILGLIEPMLIELSAKVSDKQIMQVPFPVVSYDEAMDKYGVDRPDLRFDLHLFDLTEVVAKSEFGVFSNAVKAGGQVKGVLYPGGADMTRREIDQLTDFVKQYGAKGMAWLGVTGAADGDGNYGEDALRTQIAKFLSQKEINGIIETSGANVGDLIMIVADKPSTTAQCLSNLRMEVGRRAKLINEDILAFCWVVDFPLFDYNEDLARWQATHHPFTAAKDEDWAKLETDTGDVKAKAYDVILNGWELGGGSIRIHNDDQQNRLFSVLGMEGEEIDAQFAHLIEAFQYGAPPHGGIALGIDRVVALYADVTSIRDVIAFPKTAAGTDLMVNAPSPIETAQLNDLHIMLKPSGKTE